jgi:hypothetical protein
MNARSKATTLAWSIAPPPPVTIAPSISIVVGAATEFDTKARTLTMTVRRDVAPEGAVLNVFIKGFSISK